MNRTTIIAITAALGGLLLGRTSKRLRQRDRTSEHRPMNEHSVSNRPSKASRAFGSSRSIDCRRTVIILPAAVFLALVFHGCVSIHTAARRGDVAAVRRMVEAGTSPNRATSEGATPLMYAAQAGNVELVRYLLAKGADPNAQAKNGATPISSARAGKHYEIIRILIEAGGERGATMFSYIRGRPLPPEAFRDSVVFRTELAGNERCDSKLAGQTWTQVRAVRMPAQDAVAVHVPGENGGTILFSASCFASVENASYPPFIDFVQEVRTLDGRVFKDVRASAVPGKVQIETRDGRTIEFKMSELKPYPVG